MNSLRSCQGRRARASLCAGGADLATASLRTDAGPDDPTLSFLVFGDSGNSSSNQLGLLDAMKGRDFHLAIHTGDVAYPHGTYRQLDDYFFAVYPNLASAFPFFPSLGNHDHDTLSAHKHENVHRWLRRHRRIQLHFTPTHASWLNQVEIWFSILARKVIRRGVFPSVKALTEAIITFIEHYNQEGKPFTWTFTPERLETIVINRAKH